MSCRLAITNYTHDCRGAIKTHIVHNYPSGYLGARGKLGACVETRVDTSISAKELASWTSHRQATINTRQREQKEEAKM
jgi:hypothetical protein